MDRIRTDVNAELDLDFVLIDIFCVRVLCLCAGSYECPVFLHPRSLLNEQIFVRIDDEGREIREGGA